MKMYSLKARQEAARIQVELDSRGPRDSVRAILMKASSEALGALYLSHATVAPRTFTAANKQVMDWCMAVLVGRQERGA